MVWTEARPPEKRIVLSISCIMRVLHLIPTMGGGGAERQISLLAPALASSGIEVHIACAKFGSNYDPETLKGVSVHRIEHRGNYDPIMAYRIYRLILQIRPHLIQTWIPQMDILGGFLAICAGKPFVISERSSGLAYPSSWKTWLRIRLGRRAAAVVANSGGGAAYWAARAPLVRNVVVRNGLLLSEIRSVPTGDLSTVGLPSGLRLILFAGRLEIVKNIEKMLLGIERILLAEPDCCALLAGDGPLRWVLEARLKESNVAERIRWIGYSTRVWEWMKRASVFVSVSNYEGCPNAVLEALASGCPVVVSDIPAHREFLDDSTAVFCDQNNPEAIEVAIRLVLGCANSERTQKAQTKMEDWSIDSAVASYVQLYNSVLSM